MEDSDDRKRKKPESLLADGLTLLNPRKFAKSQDEVAISKLDRRDSDGGATKPELDPKGEENGCVGEEVKQDEQLISHSGGEGQGAKMNEALDPQGTGSSANGKDKEIVKDKGKGKILVESETEDEDDDDEEDGGVGGVDEDTDTDLSDDPLIEVDPANILPSWSWRRTAHSGPYPMSTVPGVDDDDDEDDDDISGDEDEVDDDNDEDDDEEDDDDEGD